MRQMMQMQAAARRGGARSARPARMVFSGNQARLRRLMPPNLQAKLTIGAVDDPLEREADHVANQVMRMPESGFATTAAPLRVSRQCAACEEDAHKLRAKPAAATPGMVANAPPAIVHDVLGTAGRPLDPTARAFMERRFGQDFAHVRVHADDAAAQSAGAIGAAAYTVGSQIVFGAGRYTPHTGEGRRLLAHELAHTIQQRATGQVRRSAALDMSAGTDDIVQRACADKTYRTCSGGCVPDDGRGTGFCAWSGSIATGCVCYRRDQPMLREIQQILFNAIIAALIAAGIVLTIAAIAAIIACLSGPCEAAALIAACGYGAAMIVLGIIGAGGKAGATGGSLAASTGSAGGNGNGGPDASATA